jgi:hypothetical protein
LITDDEVLFWVDESRGRQVLEDVLGEKGDVKLVIAEKETDEDEESPVEYLGTNKIDAPTEHVIRSYGMR